MIFRSTSSRSRRRFPERRARFPPPRSLVRVRERHRWTRRASFRHHHRPRSRARSPDARARASAPTKDADVARDGDRWPKSRLFARPLGGSLASADSPPLRTRARARAVAWRRGASSSADSWKCGGKTEKRPRARVDEKVPRARWTGTPAYCSPTRGMWNISTPQRARARGAGSCADGHTHGRVRRYI